jgi:hypothetical protein
MRNRQKVVLHMVMAFVIMILLAQLSLFTITLDAMENREATRAVAITALAFSFMGSAAVWALIRFFLGTENNK